MSHISSVKALARDRMLGKYGTTIAATLLYMVIEMGAALVVSSIIPATSVPLLLMGTAAAFLVQILMGVLASGMAYMYLNVAYGQPVSAGDMFFGFSQHPDKAVRLETVFAASELLLIIPFQLWRFTGVPGIFPYIVVIGAAVYLYIRLVFSQVFFILHDFPDRETADILRTSMELMRGQKLRLLLMYLSFIPLVLLGFITFFLPLLWVSSYVKASEAAFYQKLVNKELSRNNQ